MLDFGILVNAAAVGFEDDLVVFAVTKHIEDVKKHQWKLTISENYGHDLSDWTMGKTAELQES